MVLWKVAAQSAVLAPTDAALGQIVVQNRDYFIKFVKL